MLNSAAGNSSSIKSRIGWQIGKADMPLVRARVNGQTARPRLQGGAAKAGYGWPGEIAPVAQHGDGIEIYGELCRHIGTFRRDAPIARGAE